MGRGDRWARSPAEPIPLRLVIFSANLAIGRRTVRILSPLLLAAFMIFLGPVIPALPIVKSKHGPVPATPNETVVFKTSSTPFADLRQTSSKTCD
jgi:hypothetical protein